MASSKIEISFEQSPEVQDAFTGQQPGDKVSFQVEGTIREMLEGGLTASVDSVSKVKTTEKAVDNPDSIVGEEDVPSAIIAA